MTIDQIWIIYYYGFMKIEILLHNKHLEYPALFAEQDPHLSRLKNQTFIHHPSLLDELPYTEPGIYTLGGGRQIGKTTLLKQWMLKLLQQQAEPANIFFLSGEMIDDHHQLLKIIEEILPATNPAHSLFYLIIDEVTYIKDWDKAIKFAADAGMFTNVVVLLSGSDLVLMKQARMRFPGRRGLADKTDFHLYPLSFYEFVKLTQQVENAEVLRFSAKLPTQNEMTQLFTAFQHYLIHGGYLTAINDYAKSGFIHKATLQTYSDWVRGDMLKRNKQEHSLQELMGGIIKRYGSQITWHALAKDLSIEHHQTVADYIALLESMDVVLIQQALVEDKLSAAPKKARKVFFTDPFIFHAIHAWVKPVAQPFTEQMQPFLQDNDNCASLVEGCVVAHYHRLYPTYYIKAESEVDVAYIDQGKFWPVEIKWTNQLRAKDLKQISKYSRAKILARNSQPEAIGNIPVIALPLGLLRL
jgi:predicted AAA+ superfamily ATPase